jgi:opacity protein-like surface antigen
MGKLNLRMIAFAFVAAVMSQPAVAQGPWTAAVHFGGAEVDRLITSTDEGAWWSRVDDRRAALGASVAYDFLPMLGVRLMYERGPDYAAENVCPPGATCAAVAIGEEMDFTAWHLAAVPRIALAPDWSLFGTLGAMRWKLRQDTILPGDSGTEFTYGAGLAWRITPSVELGLEYQRSGIDYDTLRFNLGMRF